MTSVVVPKPTMNLTRTRDVAKAKIPRPNMANSDIFFPRPNCREEIHGIGNINMIMCCNMDDAAPL